MNDNYSYLVIPFIEFERVVNDMAKEGDALIVTPNNENILDKFKESTETWIEKVKSIFNSSFENDDYYIKKMKPYVRLNISQGTVYFQVLNEYKNRIRQLSYYIQSVVKIISVCSYISNRQETQVKTNLSITEKASLLLEKLYLLGTESNYSARMLLVGNGVELKAADEAIELARYLADRGLVSISHYNGNDDLFTSITTEGKVLYETETRKIKATKNSVQVELSTVQFSKIFIVHGHNNEMKEAVARVVDRIGFKSVILHEMVDQGRTIIEKFTDHSNEVQYAIVLLSADDYAYPKSSTNKYRKLRPRQNVVFELGYFIGKLGRSRVFVLYETFYNFELHSHFQGVVLTPYDINGAWKMKLGKELESLGIEVDWNALMR